MIKKILKNMIIPFALGVLVVVAFEAIIAPAAKRTTERVLVSRGDLELMSYRNIELGKTIGRSAMMEWWAMSNVPKVFEGGHSETSITIDMDEYLKYEDKRAKEIIAERRQEYE